MAFKLRLLWGSMGEVGDVELSLDPVVGAGAAPPPRWSQWGHFTASSARRRISFAAPSSFERMATIR